jgi:hypothetical protein
MHAASVTAVLAVPTPAAQFPGHVDKALVPCVFVAVTANRYHTPFVSPNTVAVTAASETTMLQRTLQCKESDTVASQVHAAFLSQADAVL